MIGNAVFRHATLWLLYLPTMPGKLMIKLGEIHPVNYSLYQKATFIFT